jgi:MFS family permease
MPARQPASPAMPDWLIRNRNFVLLWLAYGISAFGDNFNDTAQLKLMDALQSEQSVRLMALMMFGLFLPYVVLGPLAGWCADRFSRRGIMISADLARAVIILGFATLIPWLKPQAGDFTVMFSQMTLGLLAVFFSPARQALVPTLVRSDQLVRANALIGALAPVAAMLGFLVGGYLVDIVGATWNFRINAVTYAGSAACVLAIAIPRHAVHKAAPAKSVLAPLVEGFTYVRQHRRVLELILLGALFWGAAGVVYSCVPAIVKMLGSERYADVGNYRALTAAGMILGAVFMSIFGNSIRVPTAIRAGQGIAGVWLVIIAIGLSIAPSKLVATISLLGVGFGGALLIVTINASIQRFVPDSRRGRVFGVSDMATTGAMVLSTGLIGLPNIPALDQYTPILLLATAAALLLTMLIRGYGRR